MDFAFTPEQEELRAQARAFLAANPEPSWQELAELGWTGVSVPEERRRRRARLPRGGDPVRGDGPRALTHAPYWSTVAVVAARAPARPAGRGGRAARRAGRSRSGPLVADLDTADADRVRRRRLDLGARRGRARGAADERRDPAARRRVGRRGRAAARELRAAAAASGALAGGARRSRRAASGRGRSSSRSTTRRSAQQFGKPIGTYQAVSHPLATTPDGARARPLARALRRLVHRRGRRRGRRSRRRRRSRTARTRPWPRASGRSRCTAGSASPGSTSCTGSTSGRSWIQAWEASGGAAPLRGRGTICSTATGGDDGRADDGLPAQRAGDPAARRGALRRQEIVSRLPDKSWHRYTYADFARRDEAARARAAQRARPRRR